MFAEVFSVYTCTWRHVRNKPTISISLRNACPLHYLDILQHQFEYRDCVKYSKVPWHFAYDHTILSALHMQI